VSFVDLARRFVLRTNDWPGLGRLYHEAYEVGLSITTSRLKSVPGVLAVMVRVGDDGRTWTPGLSDYDITVLTEPLDPARMLRFLDELWGCYRRIKRSIPQLGETEVMSVDEYQDFLAFGPLPLSAIKRADPLFVRTGAPEVERVLQRSARPPRERELLLDALSRYIWFLLPAWLHHASEPSSASRRRAEHLLDNVVKRLDYHGRPAEPRDTASLTEGILRVFGDLTRACREITAHGDGAAVALGSGAGGAVDGSGGAVAGAIPSIEAFAAEALRRTKVRDCSVRLWISYMSGDKLNLAFVLPDETRGDTVWQLVATLGTMHRHTQGLWTSAFTNGDLQRHFPSLPYPLVVSRSMWTCWRELSPFDGVAIAASGRTLMGPGDTVRGLPSMAALTRGVEVKYASLLPLKNNWRPLRGPGSPWLYAAMLNHVKGYASALSGRVLTSPTTYEFPSTQAGYEAVGAELSVLRERLTG
jgi:hypothetical protein